MANYTVKLIITNEENQEHISYEGTFNEETTQKVIDAYLSITRTIRFLDLDDIR